MMFERSNTNFKGQSLCFSCAYGLPVAVEEVYHCRYDFKEVKDVGVCKYYEAAKNNKQRK